MYLITIYSEKGGVGKSSLSHALALGASLVEDPNFGIIVGHTDRRDPVVDETRPYQLIDMRDPQTVYDVLQKVFESEEDGALIIDTGANMSELSRIILPAVDLILVSTIHDYDSVRMALSAGKEHPEKTAYVINQSPSKHAPEYRRFEKNVLSHFTDGKTIIQFPQLRAVSELVNPIPLDSYSRSRLRPHCVKFWREVKDLFE